MTMQAITTRGGTAKTAVHLLCECVSLLLILLAVPAVIAQQLETAPVIITAPLTTEQVVQNLVRMNLHRLEALQAYQGTRTYKVEYRGFSGDKSAEMIVEVKYQSPGTKEFSIQSTSGSKLIIEKLFKKLLEAEKEALKPGAQQRTALNLDNYVFNLVGYESTPEGSMYVLSVEPRTKEKFLYRGYIWVDAKDFAVVRLKAEPAKNPSFWTKRSEIDQEYRKVSNFWLPAVNRSVSSIRLGGRAELTIQYNNYQITSAKPLDGSLTEESSASSDSSRQRKGDLQ